jgi:hypothetical protein
MSKFGEKKDEFPVILFMLPFLLMRKTTRNNQC